MRYLILSILFLCIISFFACDETPTVSQEAPEAKVTITSMTKAEESTLVEFEIENTGSVHIDNWWISFETTTENDVFWKDAGGQDIAVGEMDTGYFWVGTIETIVHVKVLEIKY